MKKVTDLQPNPHNLNQGSERGIGMLERSIEQYGVGRGVVVDRDGKSIGGWHVIQAAAEKGIPIRVIQTTGDELVVTQRTDLSLSHKDMRAQELAIADNRVSQVNFTIDPAALKRLDEAGAALDSFWFEGELERLRESFNDGDSGDDSAPMGPKKYSLLITQLSERKQRALLKELSERGLQVKVIVS